MTQYTDAFTVQHYSQHTVDITYDLSDNAILPSTLGDLITETYSCTHLREAAYITHI